MKKLINKFKELSKFKKIISMMVILPVVLFASIIVYSKSVVLIDTVFGTNLSKTANNKEYIAKQKEKAIANELAKNKEDKEKKAQVHSESEKEVQSLTLDNIKTYNDVNIAYEQNIEKIMKKEKLRELDMMSITKDDVLNYAKKSSEIARGIEGSSDKIDTVDKLVSLNDLENNTTQKTMEEVLSYIISEYENNQLQDVNKMLEYQYIVSYLDKRLDNHPNMKSADEMIQDMYQICKDIIRNDNSRMNANIEQVNSNINSVKFMIE